MFHPVRIAEPQSSHVCVFRPVRIAELQSSHRLEVGRLQEELVNARAMAEQQQHHTGDVSIGMEDLAEGGGTTNGDTSKL